MNNPYKGGWRNKERKREYQREWKKNRVKKLREEYILKRGGACERCNCSIDLEFHHRLPIIKTTHRIFSYSRKRIEAELLYCDLLCRHPCHTKAQKEVKKPRKFCGL